MGAASFVAPSALNQRVLASSSSPLLSRAGHRGKLRDPNPPLPEGVGISGSAISSATNSAMGSRDAPSGTLGHGGRGHLPLLGRAPAAHGATVVAPSFSVSVKFRGGEEGREARTPPLPPGPPMHTREATPIDGQLAAIIGASEGRSPPPGGDGALAEAPDADVSGEEEMPTIIAEGTAQREAAVPFAAQGGAAVPFAAQGGAAVPLAAGTAKRQRYAATATIPSPIAHRPVRSPFLMADSTGDALFPVRMGASSPLGELGSPRGDLVSYRPRHSRHAVTTTPASAAAALSSSPRSSQSASQSPP